MRTKKSQPKPIEQRIQDLCSHNRDAELATPPKTKPKAKLKKATTAPSASDMAHSKDLEISPEEQGYPVNSTNWARLLFTAAVCGLLLGASFAILLASGELTLASREISNFFNVFSF